jgi:hypothetical protein
LCSRWSLDVLARLLATTIDAVTLPEPRPSRRHPAHQLMAAALGPGDTDQTGDPYERQRLQRVAAYLERVDRYGATFDEDTMADTAEILGHRPRSWREADAELERMVLEAEPQLDAAFVRLFHRRLQREELLLEPVLGYLRNSRIPPIDDAS